MAPSRLNAILFGAFALSALVVPAIYMGRFLSGLLYGVEPLDPVSVVSSRPGCHPSWC